MHSRSSGFSGGAGKGFCLLLVPLPPPRRCEGSALFLGSGSLRLGDLFREERPPREDLQGLAERPLEPLGRPRLVDMPRRPLGRPRLVDMPARRARRAGPPAAALVRPKKILGLNGDVQGCLLAVLVIA